MILLDIICNFFNPIFALKYTIQIDKKQKKNIYFDRNIIFLFWFDSEDLGLVPGLSILIFLVA